jgi:hypothetical protein
MTGKIDAISQFPAHQGTLISLVLNPRALRNDIAELRSTPAALSQKRDGGRQQENGKGDAVAMLHDYSSGETSRGSAGARVPSKCLILRSSAAMSVRSTIDAAATPIVIAIVSLSSSLVAPNFRPS